MGTAERREREREQVRTRIVEAARDILSEDGLAALSMRGIAERIEYSPAAIYLYFRDKDELIREVVAEGFERLEEYVQEDLAALGPRAQQALERYRAMGRAYARFALENTAYFRVMFELPAVAHLDCPVEENTGGEAGFDRVVATVAQAAAERNLPAVDAARSAVVGWGLIHGLTSLYLGGHLGWLVGSNAEFLDLIEDAHQSVFGGWQPDADRVTSSPAKTAAADPGED